MLFNSFIHFFIIISHQFLFPFTNAISLVEDKMLISFMRNDQKMQISDYLKQKYEAHLGIMYFMKKNWHCDKIPHELKEHERTECQKYRKYLDILYEYLYREYVGIPTVKPIFVLKNRTVNCLAKLSQFYFKSYWSKYDKYKLNQLFNYYGNFEPKLLYEQRLNYILDNEQKLPINEMILQLAIDKANEWQTILEGIILQNCEEKFEEYLEEMFRKAEERAKEDNQDRSWIVNEINEDKHKIIVASKFDYQLNWIEDAFFRNVSKD